MKAPLPALIVVMLVAPLLGQGRNATDEIPVHLRAKFRQYADAMAQYCYSADGSVGEVPADVLDAFAQFEKDRLSRIRDKEKMVKTIRPDAKDVRKRLKKERQALVAIATKDRSAKRRTSFVSELSGDRTFGTLPGDTKVVQVIDKENVIVSPYGTWVWVQGFATDGLVDSQGATAGPPTFSEVSGGRIAATRGEQAYWADGKVFKVAGTKTYKAVAGSNTIQVIEPVDLAKYRPIPKLAEILSHLSAKGVSADPFIEAGNGTRSKGSKDVGRALARRFAHKPPGQKAATQKTPPH